MFSQYNEDDVVMKIFGSHVGNMLDIGSWGVEDFSNSRAFILAGWTATLIEVSPKPMDALLRAYGYNPKVRLIQAAITADEQPLLQFEITEDALSTSEAAQLSQWKNMSSDGTEGANRGGYYGRMLVASLSVQRLIDQCYGEMIPDFASIDTEGTSVPVALALMATDWRPRVVCVEYDQQLPYLLERAQEWGYKAVHTNSTNVILEK